MSAMQFVYQKTSNHDYKSEEEMKQTPSKSLSSFVDLRPTPENVHYNVYKKHYCSPASDGGSSLQECSGL